MITKFSQTLLGDRKTSEYGTPLDFFNKLNSIFKFRTDPCAFPENRLRLAHTYTKEYNGLIHSWPWNTFINPPFGRKKTENIRAWIQKMQIESNGHPDSNYVMLLPCRLESNWFQELVFSDKYKILFIVRGRLVFYNPKTNKNNDPHPLGSILYIRGQNITTDMVHELKKRIPGIFIDNANW